MADIALYCAGRYPDYRNDGQEWAEHLASQGYVVVGVDHADCSNVAYPDGMYIFTDPNDLWGRESSIQLLQDRVRDLVVVLDEMARWNKEDGLFAGRIDVQNTAVLGWSLGGATAGEFCRSDGRCRAAVALDPGGYETAPTLTTFGLQKPSLTMHRSDYADTTLFSKATTNAYWFQVRYTQHANFATCYWCTYWVSVPLDRGREAARTIADYSLWFMNKYLKGATDPMPKPTTYPQLFNFKQK